MRQLLIAAFIFPIFVFAEQNPRDELIAQGNALKAAGDFAKAESLYSAWLSTHPDDAEVDFSLAQVLFWQDQFKASLAILDELAAKEPQNPEVAQERELVKRALQGDSFNSASVGAEFASYDFFPTNSVGLTANLSLTQRKHWAIRAGAHGVNKFDVSGVEGFVGGSYWLNPDWAVDLDFSLGSRGDIMSQFTSVIGTSYAISNDFTPSFSFRYSGYDVANVFIFSPEITWRAFSFLSFDGKLFAALTQFNDAQNVATCSGLLRINFEPFDYFSLFAGASAGQEAFDPGNPNASQISFINEHAFGGMKFTLQGHVGAELSMDREWRNNNENITSGEFSVFYTW